MPKKNSSDDIKKRHILLKKKIKDRIKRRKRKKKEKIKKKAPLYSIHSCILQSFIRRRKGGKNK